MDYTEISTEDLAKAITLLVRPEQLSDRGVMIAVLRALEISPKDVRDVVECGEPAFEGAHISLV